MLGAKVCECSFTYLVGSSVFFRGLVVEVGSEYWVSRLYAIIMPTLCFINEFERYLGL